MNCTICNTKLRLSPLSLTGETIHHCPHGCHFLVIHPNGNQIDEFSAFLDGYQVSVANHSERILYKGRPTNQSKKFSVIRFNGWEIGRFNDHVSAGTKLEFI